MINLITGVPGAGKTYFAVKFIYDELNSKNPKFKCIYTNINLNFNKCEKIKKDFVKPLNLDDLLKRIQSDYEMSELFKNNQLFDDETGELITDYDSYVRGKLKLFEPYQHSLIILDEAHLYFTSVIDEKLLRFLSYHRHYDIDMFFITQNKSLINRKYLAFIENMYIGSNPSKRFFSKIFVYKLYASWKEYKTNYVGKEKYKFNPVIASCYNSGSTKIRKSFTFRLFLPLFILFFIAFFGFIAFKNYVSCGSIFGCSHISSVKSSSIVSKQNINKKQDFQNNSFTSFSRSSFDFSSYRFYYKLVCFKYKCIVNNKFIVTRNFLSFLKKRSHVLFDEIVFPYETIFLVTNFDLSKLQGGNNETNNSNSFFNN